MPTARQPWLGRAGRPGHREVVTLALSLFCMEITLLVPGSPVLTGRSPDRAASVPGGAGGLPSVPPQRVRGRAEVLAAALSVYFLVHCTKFSDMRCDSNRFELERLAEKEPATTREGAW